MDNSKPPLTLNLLKQEFPDLEIEEPDEDATLVILISKPPSAPEEPKQG